MNRRTFLKCGLVITVTVPFIPVELHNGKRTPKSLFTTDELRTFCRMNDFHYVEDSAIWTNGMGHKWITIENKNYWIYARWPFIHKCNSELWYECLRWNAVNWKIRYKDFYLYDIQETTLPFQKEKGEFYSMITCAKVKCQAENNNSIKRRIERTPIYCIKNHCWYKPLTDNTSDVYVYDLVKI